MSHEKKVQKTADEAGDTKQSNVISLAERRRLKEQQAVENEASSKAHSLASERPLASEAKARQQIFTKGTLTSFFALAAGAALVTLINMTLMDSNPSLQTAQFSSREGGVGGSRSPASLPGQRAGFEPSLGQRDINLERELAKQLSEPGNRGPASLGRSPSLEQRLRYEYLENKYSLGFQSGKLHSIRYVPSVGLGVHPKYIEDKEQFLMDYRSLLPVDFYEPIRLERDIASSGEAISETFVLMGDDSVPTGRVLFSMDKFGRLMEMTVEVR